MADLNELSQFEKDLKALIESRGGFTQPIKEEPIRSARVSGRTEPMTLMMVSEHGQPFRTSTHTSIMTVGESLRHFDRQFDTSTYMMVWEHGQPYRQPDRPSGYSRMAVREHGQPYALTNMAVREHGQPYALTNMAVREHGQPYCRSSTDMAVRHHGRPYAQTKMKSREHGQPYRKWTDEEKEARISEKLDQVSGYLERMIEKDDEISKLKEKVDRLENPKTDHFDY